MRIRNVKDADNILKESKYYIENEKIYKNRWQKVFGNDNPIMLEIGMGKGDFIIGMAKLHPDWNFVGVEKYESVLVRAAMKLEKVELNNVKIISMDAKEISEVFDKEIDTLYLNFSDPWPKKRHHKRRLTYESFLKEYDHVFKGDAKIIMKTDNDGLFESTLVSLNNYGYVFDSVHLDLWSTDLENVKTEYEIKFSNKGFKIKYISAHKKI